MKNKTENLRSVIQHASLENATLADQIISDLSKAKPTKRTRYTIELPSGLKIETRSNRSSMELIEKFSPGLAKTKAPPEPVETIEPSMESIGHHDFGPNPFEGRPHYPHLESATRGPSVDPAYLAHLERLAFQHHGWSDSAEQRHSSWQDVYPGYTPYPAQPTWQQAPQCTVLMSQRTPTFLAWVGQKKYQRSTMIDYRFTLRIFKELVGDKRLCDLGVDDADAFIAAMNAWPIHASKKREYRLMTAPAILLKAKRLGTPTLTPVTQQKHIERLRVFFRWLEGRNEVRPGLLFGVRLHRNVLKPGQTRKPFDEADLKVIFDPKFDARLDTPWRFWAARLALYQGMRLTEIAQLYVDDIIEQEGLPCISINKDRPGQRLKNASSQRIIPIHPSIIKAGFMLYVAQVKASNLPHLFPSMTWGYNGPGDVMGDWFNRFLRKHYQITDPAKTFHSFRHSFATFGERSQVQDARMSLLLGHSSGQSVYRVHYVYKLTAKDSYEDLTNIKFPDICIGLYNPRKFDWYFERAKAEATRKERLDKVFGQA